jgi:hypothetical protein
MFALLNLPKTDTTAMKRGRMKSVARTCRGAMVRLGVVVAVAGVHAADWQWSAEVEGHAGAKGRAFLWIPPECKRVRAVVFGQNNMLEEGVLEHAGFRRELGRLGIAELFIAPSFDTWQNATNNDAANARFNVLLETFAAQSGYDELEFAPIIPIGHSAMASFPWNFAAWNPERTLAILSLKGDAPQTGMTGNGRPNADWGVRKIDGIPGVMVMAEYEWVEGRLQPAMKFRAAHPNSPIAMLALPGRGHFDFDDELVDYLARFIRKAMQARIVKGSFERAAPDLAPVDPSEGWLVPRWRQDQAPPAKAARFAQYAGDGNEAFWAFDREMARLTEKFNASQCCKEPQLLGFVQNGRTIPQTDTHYQVAVKFQPMHDGVTFKIATTFLDAVDAGSANCSRWTGLPAGTPLRHARGGGPIQVSRITGPAAQLAADTFALRFNRFSLPSDSRAGDIWLLARHPGDARFKSTVQQALITIPLRLSEGAGQRISFPRIADVKAGTKTVKLPATCDSGEKVYYFVREGPAEVAGDELRISKIPPRAKFPVRITVVAWQYGRNFEPKLKTAEPVERTFLITK